MLARAHHMSAALIAAVVFGSGPAFAKCRMKDPDLTIAGIRLLDAQSAAEVVGSGAELRGGEEDLPHASFVNEHGNEQLDLFAHYGASVDEYAEAEVHEAGSQALVLKDLPVESFITGRGVGLGMTARDVIKLFGTCVKARESDGDAEIIQYEITRSQMEPVMLGLGYDSYFAEYEFSSGKLVRFRFGFEHR